MYSLLSPLFSVVSSFASLSFTTPSSSFVFFVSFSPIGNVPFSLLSLASPSTGRFLSVSPVTALVYSLLSPLFSVVSSFASLSFTTPSSSFVFFVSFSPIGNVPFSLLSLASPSTGRFLSVSPVTAPSVSETIGMYVSKDVSFSVPYSSFVFSGAM